MISGSAENVNPGVAILPSPPVQPSDPKKARLDSDPTPLALNVTEQEEETKEEWLDAMEKELGIEPEAVDSVTAARLQQLQQEGERLDQQLQAGFQPLSGSHPVHVANSFVPSQGPSLDLNPQTQQQPACPEYDPSQGIDPMQVDSVQMHAPFGQPEGVRQASNTDSFVMASALVSVFDQAEQPVQQLPIPQGAPMSLGGPQAEMPAITAAPTVDLLSGPAPSVSPASAAAKAVAQANRESYLSLVGMSQAQIAQKVVNHDLLTKEKHLH